MAQSERRKFPRFDREEHVLVRLHADADHPRLREKTFLCSTSNLSGGGLQVAVDLLVPVGTVLHVWVKMSDPPKSFMLGGRVVWVEKDENWEGYRLGIQFTDDPPENVRLWRRMIHERFGTPPD